MWYPRACADCCSRLETAFAANAVGEGGDRRPGRGSRISRVRHHHLHLQHYQSTIRQRLFGSRFYDLEIWKNSLACFTTRGAQKWKGKKKEKRNPWTSKDLFGKRKRKVEARFQKQQGTKNASHTKAKKTGLLEGNGSIRLGINSEASEGKKIIDLMQNSNQLNQMTRALQKLLCFRTPDIFITFLKKKKKDSKQNLTTYITRNVQQEKLEKQKKITVAKLLVREKWISSALKLSKPGGAESESPRVGQTLQRQKAATTSDAREREREKTKTMKGLAEKHAANAGGTHAARTKRTAKHLSAPSQYIRPTPLRIT